MISSFVHRPSDFGIFNNTYTNLCGANWIWGAYQEMIAACPFEACGLYFRGQSNLAGTYYVEFRLAFGSAGSEVIVVPDLFDAGYTSSAFTIPVHLLPLRIPKGTRISIAGRNTYTGARTAWANIQIIGANHWLNPGFNRFVSYGLDGSGYPTSIGTGGAAWTYGSWVEIESSTAEALRALCLYSHDGVTGSNVGHGGIIQLGVGSAGSEVPIITKCWGGSRYGTVRSSYQSTWLRMSIPAGSRLAVREAAASSASAASKCYVIGVT